MADLITVVMPVYKVEKFLDRAVRSVLCQTYENLEIILVDDGSPDNCPALCDAYAQKDGRIRVIHQENKGLSGARNAGIAEAKGLYIAFIDSDDYWAPDFIETLYSAIKATGSEVAIGRWEYVHGIQMVDLKSLEPAKKPMIIGGRKIDKNIYTFTRQELMENLYSPDGAYFVVAWNKLYSRDLFWEVRYPVGKIHEDEATTHRLYHICSQGVFVNRPLYGYYVSDNSITHGFNPKRLDWIWSVKSRVDFFERSGYPEMMRQALQALADGAIDIYFGVADYQPDNKEALADIRGLIADGLRRVKPYGSFPLRTLIGYRLFLMLPKLYRKLLNKVKAENGKQ